MKNNIFYFFLIQCLFCLVACEESNNVYYLDKDLPAPSQVTNLNIINTPGGAKITYEIPKENIFSYAKAVYEIQPGVFREAKSSYYKDTLELVGFGDTLVHQVKIFSVGRNEKESAPVTVDVKPLLPPFLSVFQTLNFKPTFGGVNITFENDSRAELAVFVMIDSTGTNSWEPLETFYTAAEMGNFSARGLESKERNFLVYLRDRWNNKSDTLFTKLTPLFESEIPKSSFECVHLPNDSWRTLNQNVIERVWDDNTSTFYAALDHVTLPQWWTLDLKEQVLLSRMKLFHRYGYEYTDVAVKAFEIWGSNNPDPDGSWDNWVLLGEFESYKPSGLPGFEKNAEDVAYARGGEDFVFNQPVPPVRYIRFKLLGSYSGDAKYQLAELTFWGQIVQ